MDKTKAAGQAGFLRSGQKPNRLPAITEAGIQRILNAEFARTFAGIVADAKKQFPQPCAQRDWRVVTYFLVHLLGVEFPKTMEEFEEFQWFLLEHEAKITTLLNQVRSSPIFVAATH